MEREREAPPVAAPDHSVELALAIAQDVRAILRVLDGSSVEELRIERGGRSVTVRRAWQDAPSGTVAAEMPPPPAALSRLAVAGRTEVRAQVVGVFHASRTLDGPVLANAGDIVEVDTALGVVETLGIASDVLAPIRGRLADLVVVDGQPVEYGELLAVIEPE